MYLICLCPCQSQRIYNNACKDPFESFIQIDSRFFLWFSKWHSSWEMRHWQRQRHTTTTMIILIFRFVIYFYYNSFLFFFFFCRWLSIVRLRLFSFVVSMNTFFSFRFLCVCASLLFLNFNCVSSLICRLAFYFFFSSSLAYWLVR